MAYSVQIDEVARANARHRLAEARQAERKGHRADFAPLQAERWLKDSAVIEQLAHIRGEWRVSLVFAHIHNPLRLIQRYITSHPTRHRAALQAHYMRRLAAKDQRGTLTVHFEQLRLCLN